MKLKRLITSASASVTLAASLFGATWDASKVYTDGMQAEYNGKVYKAAWWTQGDAPGTQKWGPWKLIHGEVQEESTSTWSASKVYTQGMKAQYNGITYIASWWNKGSIPGSETWGPWKKVNTDDSITPTEPVDPIVPVEPSNPTEPITPTDPVEPSNPTEPSQPVEPSNPTEPTIPTDPVDPIVPVEPTEPKPSTDSTQMVRGTYFVEWGVYGRNFHVADIPAEKLSHILYGFIAICGPNDSLQQANGQGYSALVSQCSTKQDYEVTIHDKYAALEKSYPGDKWDDPIRGNFGQLIKLKKEQPHLKIMPSIGGWTLSDPFFTMAASAEHRKTFVDSAVAFIKKYDFFDGIDIDWEFPGGGGSNPALGSAEDKEHYTLLMQDLRAGLDALSVQTGKTYELTTAIGTGKKLIGQVDYSTAQESLDYIFMMSYDYYGAWNGVIGHQTGLYAAANEKMQSFNVNDSVNAMLAQGVNPSKLVVGVAKYGRGWKNVSGMSGSDFSLASGNGAIKGTWENGILDYKDIASNYYNDNTQSGMGGFEYFYDETAQAAYLYNDTSKEFITFDNVRSVKAKGEYVKEHQLGGLFSWEIDADNGDIVNAMNEGLE